MIFYTYNKKRENSIAMNNKIWIYELHEENREGATQEEKGGETERYRWLSPDCAERKTNLQL